jgi:hypothetical protein
MQAMSLRSLAYQWLHVRKESSDTVKIIRETTVRLSPFALRKLRCFRGAKDDTILSNGPCHKSSAIVVKILPGESQSAERLSYAGESATYPNLSEIPASGNKVRGFTCGIVTGLDDTR